MNLGIVARVASSRPSLNRENRYHGFQLAAAVVIAYLASMAVGLPEHFWAVMSVLIVMRPSTGDTLGAGWDRVLGTVVGVFFGLLGVYFEHLGAGMLLTTLLIVATLAFASAAAPSLRSASVAALIILAAGALPHHSALQAASIRVIQILIGVGVAVAVALISSRYRAAERFDAACAALLQGTAARLRQSNPRDRTAAMDAARLRPNVRNALSLLGVLAGSADRESRLFRRAAPGFEAGHHRLIAESMSRIFQDVMVLNRALLFSQRQDHGLSYEVAQAVAAALDSVAGAIKGTGSSQLSGLHKFDLETRDLDAERSLRPMVLLAMPLHLLVEDLRQIAYALEKSKHISHRQSSS